MTYRMNGLGLGVTTVPQGWYLDSTNQQQQQASKAQSTYTSTATKYAPGGAPSCATADQKKQADYDCRNEVRGLGATPYTGGPFMGMDPCAVARLPTCITMTRLGLVCPPGQAVDPATGKCAVPPQVVKTVVDTESPPPPSPSCGAGTHLDLTTNLCVSDDTGEPVATSTKTYLMWGGLVLLLVAGGGYVAYKATR